MEVNAQLRSTVSRHRYRGRDLRIRSRRFRVRRNRQTPVLDIRDRICCHDGHALLAPTDLARDERAARERRRAHGSFCALGA